MTFRMPSWPDHQACSVEVLIVPGCPGAELAMRRVREAAEATGVDTNVRVRIVEREEHAVEVGFVGSPTVRVDGRDVEDGASERPVGLACRIYGDGEVVERAPPADWIVRAIRAARGG